MGFNVTHHHDAEANEDDLHIHSGDKKHIHYNDSNAKDHHKSKGEKDNCCNNDVMKFNQLDKTLASFSQPNAIFFTTVTSSFLNIDVFAVSQTTISIKHFVRSYHPPIQDIRIAIQSFQI